MYLGAKILCLSLSVLAFASFQVYAFSQSELVSYAEKIFKLLNNKEKCTLPTYEEVDVLQKTFNELETIWGTEAANKFGGDYKLVEDTILDQWTSFQKYLNDQNVIRAPKKRAFLNKVEKYQKNKFGFSICSSNPDSRKELPDDKEYEKNPLVRYVKQVQSGEFTGAASSPTFTDEERRFASSVEPLGEDADVELKFKVPPKEGASDQTARQYTGKFTFKANRAPHRITLELNKYTRK